MLYMIKHRFKADVDDARAAARPAHVAHIEGAGDKLKGAGPLMGSDADVPTGSLIIIQAGSHTAAALFAETDPYVLAGIVESTEIEAWNCLLGAWGQG